MPRFAKRIGGMLPVDAEVVETENQGQKLPQLWEKIRHLVNLFSEDERRTKTERTKVSTPPL